MNIKTTLKSSVAVAALFAVAAPVANAADDTLKSGNKNSLTMSGQITRALSYADDGSSEKVFNTSGDFATSRIRWIASGSLSANVTAGATVEMDLPRSNNPNNMTLGSVQADGVNSGSDSTWAIRHEYVWVNHKKFGRLALGQTDTATNGTAETDYSGTTMFGNSAGQSYGQGISFMDTSVNAATGNAASTSSVTVGEAFNHLDGGSRDDVLRYDTPRFYGLKLAASSIAGGKWDVAADYQAKFGAFKVRAQAGYLDHSANHASQNFQTTGSLAVLHDSGLNFALASGKLNYAGAASKVTTSSGETEGVEDPNYFYWSIGYQAKVFSVGKTNFNFKWHNAQDFSQDSGIDDSEADAIGIIAVQDFDAIGASIGLEYINYSFDANNGTVAKTFDDVDVLTLMTIFKF